MLAAKIQADGIDILVDLTGHTAGNRLLTFARKPAPIQCGWIGYLGTSGLKSIDYYLADRYFLPPGEFDRYFTEKIHYLPAVAPFQPHPHAPAIGPLPALTAGHLTFASFSRISKLNPGVIALWSQLLRALPESEMLIAAMPQDGRHQAVSEWFQTEGIAPERLQFHPRCDYGTYFALHHQADICLDPFPFTGATTTAHALWMGLPTLTLTGQTVPGRLGPALLLLAGLQDFVAHTPREFVEKGTYWAHNLDSLAELRAGMRERLLR
jgi:predicted O-linked N-acetylglucosamine transferase (SPINDLY family)